MTTATNETIFPEIAYDQLAVKILEGCEGHYHSFPARILPEVAQSILSDLNTNNRPPDSKTVAKYANDMALLRWEPRNGATISFNDDGTLDDGQQRLMAAVASQRPLDVLVVVGNTKSAFNTIDGPRRRTAGNHLGRAGHKNANNLAAALHILYRLDTCPPGTYDERLMPPSGVIPEMARDHPGLQDSIVAISQKSLNELAAKSLLAAFHYRITQKHPRLAKPFFTALTSGANLAEDSPILALRNKLTSIRSVPLEHKQAVVLCFLIKAFNAYASGKPMKNLVWKRDTANPEPFPIFIEKAKINP